MSATGDLIGRHIGTVFYTLGERHGFEITKKTPTDAPYYVVAKDIEKNTITVAHEYKGTNEHALKEVHLESVNWISDAPDPKKKYTARIRYRQPLEECNVSGTTVIFKKPQRAVTPGQSLVLYDGARVLGGGIIS